MSNNITQMPIRKPDKELADEHKKKILEKLNEVCKLIEAANKDEFEVSFGIQKGPMGNQFVAQLMLAKHF